jgi:beta-alanine degradation protein BauB
LHHLQLARATIRESTGCTPFQPLESENAEQQRNVMSKTMKTAPSEPTEGHSEVTGRGFEGWSPELIEESKKSDTNGRVGTRLLWESSVARIWVIELRPGERLTFHRHVLNYFWTVLTPGIARSHTADGLTRHVRYQPRDTKHLTFRKGEGMTHDLENVGDNDLVFVTVEFVESENAPLKL